jgi:hypothetical protein
MKSLASRERELLLEVLQTIKEIDLRKTYAEFGFSSLFVYLTEGVGYSESSAYRRIQAARLLQETPEIAEKIQSGKLNLSHIEKLQRGARASQKVDRKKVDAETKRELLKRIESQSAINTDKSITSFFDLPVQTESKITTQKDESIRLEITIPKDTFEKIQKAQGLVSHAVQSNSLVEFLEYVAVKIIKQKTVAKNENSQVEASAQKERLAANQKNNSSSFTFRNKKLALNKSPCCQYQDPGTKKVCGSTWFLQVDHRQSRWADGQGNPENAAVLCAEHNKLKYRKEVGVKLMG